MEIIASGELKIGMFIVEPDCPWTEFPFALQGFVISKPEQIDLFQQKCRFVQIDRSRSLNEHYAAPKVEHDRALQASPLAGAGREEASWGRRPLPVQNVPAERLSRRRRFLAFLHRQDSSGEAQSLSRELDYIEPRYEDLMHALQQTFILASAEKHFDFDSVREGMRDLAGSIQRNPDALMWLLRLKSVDQYSFDHAMDVAVHLLMLGTHIGWRGQRLLDLGVAGLLQDVGKTHMPAELLAKEEPLTADEQQLVRSHVASSLEILQGQGNIPTEVLLIVARHHERWDGSGYPRGLQLDQIGLAAEMAGLVDSFCAMLRNKPYRSAMGHQPAMESLFKLRDKHFSPLLMEQFVQCVGLYPIGTLVELDGGEVGVVIQQNRVRRSQPRVLLLLSADKRPLADGRVIDLRDVAANGRRIVKALPQDAYGLVAEDFYIV